MKLRNRQTMLASGEEGRAPRLKRMRVATIFYYAVLLAVLAYVVSFVTDRVRNFGTTGLVATEITQVAPSRDGRVTDLPYQPGDSVTTGDLLAIVEPGVECSITENSRLVNLAIDTRVARARRELVGARVNARQRQLEAFGTRTGLELDAEFRRERERVAKELEELQMQYSLLGTEIAALEEAMAEGSQFVASSDPRCLPDFVYAPFDATVREVHRGVFSVVMAGEPILSLKAHRAEVRVIARADPDLLPSIFIGKRVQVRFPDGTDEVGIVDTVYAAAAIPPALGIENYPLLDGDVVMEISPFDAASSATWGQSERLLVRISGRKGRR